MALKFYISVTKGLKQKVRNFCFVYMCVCVCVGGWGGGGGGGVRRGGGNSYVCRSYRKKTGSC